MIRIKYIFGEVVLLERLTDSPIPQKGNKVNIKDKRYEVQDVIFQENDKTDMYVTTHVLIILKE